MTPEIKRTKQYCSYETICFFLGFVDAVRNDAMRIAKMSKNM